MEPISEIRAFWLAPSEGKVQLILDGVEYPISLTMGEKEMEMVLTYLRHTFRLEVRHFYLHP